MEDVNMETNEVEEIENADEMDETCDCSYAGAALVGFVGGMIAYATISGAKKLKTLWEKRKAKKQARTFYAECDDYEEFEEGETEPSEEPEK